MTLRTPHSTLRTTRGRNLLIGSVVSLALLSADSAWACSVCYGDPNSPLTKGAISGVIALGAVVYALLMGFVGVGVFWMVRARRLARFSVQREDAPLAGSSSTHSGS